MSNTSPPSSEPDPTERSSRAGSFGIQMSLLGIAALVLPFFGLQLKPLKNLGWGTEIVGGILLFIGICSLIVSRSHRATDLATKATKGLLYGIIGLMVGLVLLVVVGVGVAMTGVADGLFRIATPMEIEKRTVAELQPLSEEEFKTRALKGLQSTDAAVHEGTLVACWDDGRHRRMPSIQPLWFNACRQTGRREARKRKQEFSGS